MSQEDEKPAENKDPGPETEAPSPVAPEAGAAPVEEPGVEAFDIPGDMDAAGAEALADLAQLESERNDLKDRLMRALAETENIRRRAQREKEDALKYSVANFARDMLDVADNLGRALDSIPETDDELVKAITEGVRMTEKVLGNVLERHGVRAVGAEGLRFDPNLHQAMFEIDNAEVPQGTVLQVMQKGYTIHDRLLRPAMVGVSKGGPKPAPVVDEAGGGPTSAPDGEEG